MSEPKSFESSLRDQLVRSVRGHAASDALLQARARASARVMMPLAALLTLLALVSAVVMISMRSSPDKAANQGVPIPQTGTTRSIDNNLTTFVVGTDPLISGVPTTMALAPALVGFALPSPNDPLAAPADVSNVWVDVQVDEAAVYYATSNVTIIYSKGPPDPSFSYPKIASEFAAQGATTSLVDGQQAVLIPAHTTDADGTGRQDNLASVTFAVNGVQVQILADRPLSDLVRIGGTIG